MTRLSTVYTCHVEADETVDKVSEGVERAARFQVNGLVVSQGSSDCATSAACCTAHSLKT